MLSARPLTDRLLMVRSIQTWPLLLQRPTTLKCQTKLSKQALQKQNPRLILTTLLATNPARPWPLLRRQSSLARLQWKLLMWRRKVSSRLARRWISTRSASQRVLLETTTCSSSHHRLRPRQCPIQATPAIWKLQMRGWPLSKRTWLLALRSLWSCRHSTATTTPWFQVPLMLVATFAASAACLLTAVRRAAMQL